MVQEADVTAGGGARWWENAVIYQVYLRSFADSNHDGVGDLPGLISRLDYLAWLGVDVVWCSPVTASPNRDFGYDVADYMDVDPSLGTLADVDRLVREAGRRGMRVLLDLVPNHTSDQHPWFRDPDRKRRYYVWTDRPNNWVSTFGGPAWTFDPEVGRYYLHNFLREQPDLDWWNEEVREEFDRILRFWFDRGVAGFRIDVCHGIVKDRLLRDNPPADATDRPWERRMGLRIVYNGRRPEVHDVLRRWRRIAEKYDPPRLLLGETHVYEPERLAAFYGADDELQLAQNFMFMLATFDAESLRRSAESWLEVLPPSAVPVWHASNHDDMRFPTRWCHGDERLIRLALTALLTLPGACILYQGDEIGMEDVAVPPERRRDPSRHNRDSSRTPMPWTRGRNGGFTAGEPWLPLGDLARNVADQRADPTSILHHTRSTIALKKRLRGDYEALPAPAGGWRYRRGETVIDLDFERGAALVEA